MPNIMQARCRRAIEKGTGACHRAERAVADSARHRWLVRPASLMKLTDARLERLPQAERGR
jgi:hypothetical protein